MRAKNKFTFKEHEQMGSDLRNIRKKATFWITRNAVGVSSKQAKSFKSLVRAIDRCRDCLETNLLINYPERHTYYIYFGGGS